MGLWLILCEDAAVRRRGLSVFFQIQFWSVNDSCCRETVGAAVSYRTLLECSRRAGHADSSEGWRKEEKKGEIKASDTDQPFGLCPTRATSAS